MRRHLTYANVVATLALVVAVGGGSTAIAISAKKAPKNSVTSGAIRDGSVTGKDLAGVRVVSEVVSTAEKQELRCQPGERALGGGGGGGTAAQTTSVTPTADGNGFQRVGGSGGGVTIVCLKSIPGP